MYLKNNQRFIVMVFGTLIAVITSTASIAQGISSSCGELRSPAQFGPFDYRSARNQLLIVEKYHFTPAVEALIRGSTSTRPESDLDYTLRAFPNHHKALMAIVRFGEKMKSPHPSGLNYSVECYFDRALRFQPDDTIVRMLYARFLSKLTRPHEARQQLERATTLAGDNAFTHYNIGLIYFDFKNYDKALVQAHRAIALGFVQTDLREQLQLVGKWTEPPAVPPAASSAPVGAASPPIESTTSEPSNPVN